jgi:hypothetical protein
MYISAVAVVDSTGVKSIFGYGDGSASGTLIQIEIDEYVAMRSRLFSCASILSISPLILQSSFSIISRSWML